jgi:patatin-related protein
MAADDAFDEDLRIAVVMNGGVSLAIWIGGVAQELNRLSRSRNGDGSAYAQLRELVRCTARVDVIAGTSAGGINGGFLALATAYDRPLDPLGDIWADDGGLLDLLRSPTEPNPVSLLRGDDYFLPELRKAFDRIAPPYIVGAANAVPPDRAPVNLAMTTSVVNGSLKRFEDDFGTRILEVEHKGLLRFVRGEAERDDPFVRPTITAELALAARSTASFPIAFEPSYIPVGENAGDLHPDMAGIADFGISRYVLDGGVLLNKPVRPALDAIAVQSARRQVRRVLAYVVPDPGAPADAPPDVHGKDMPTAAKVLADTLVTLPRAQSIAEELEDIRRHNRDARERGLAGAELAPLLGEAVEPLAAQLFGVYRVVRARRAVAHVADVVAPRTASADPAGPQPWTYAELLVAFGVDGDTLTSDLPFVPSTLESGEEWDWGLAPAERIGWSVLDVLRRAVRVAPVDDPVLPALAEYREQVHKVRHSLREFRRSDTAFWEARADELGTPPFDTLARRDRLAAWVERSIAVWPLVDPPAGAELEPLREAEREALAKTTRRLVDLLVDAAPLVAAAADESRARPGDRWVIAEAARVREILRGLGLADVARLGSATDVTARMVRAGVPEDVATAAAETVQATRTGRARKAATGAVSEAGARCLARLLALDVAELAITGAPAKLLDPVDLVQVSGDTPNGFGGPQTVADKLAGVQLGHFGAFYKRSWRVNDWIWGRVDGATRVVQILLDPERLRRLYPDDADGLVERLHAIAVGGPNGADLEARWQEDLPAIRSQVAYLDDDDLEPPPALTVAAFAVARRIQSELLATELPRLAAAVGIDQDEGAGGRGAGQELKTSYEAAVATGALGPDALLTLFARARIATEQITAEAGTDLFARTVSKAAAVAVSTADGKRSGLGGARLLTRALRGFTLLLYALVAGATRGSRVGDWFVNAALATGGALLAVALLAPNVAGAVKAVAALLVLAGLALSALRARTWVLAVVLAFPLTVVLAIALAPLGRHLLTTHGTTVGVVFGLVLALMVVGSVRTPQRPPLPLPKRPLARWVLLGAVFVVSLVATLWAMRWMGETKSPDLIRLEVWSWTRERAGRILAAWNTQPHGGLARGRANVVRDFAFLAVYWVPLTAAVLMVGRAVGWAGLRRKKQAGPKSFPGRLAAAAVTVSWLPLVASLLDAGENALLLAQLREFGTRGYDGFVAASPPYLPALTTTVSAWKWLLVVLSLLYVLVGLCYAAPRLLGWLWSRRPWRA